DCGHEYDVVIGTSTGSLLAPLIAIDSFAQLKEGYTNVRQKDIFNVNPFNKKGKIKSLLAFWRIITFRRTLGESKKLRKTIKHFFPEEMYAPFMGPHTDLEFIVSVTNLKEDRLEFRSSKDHDYEQMVNWMWTSANQPVFMSLYSERDSTGEKQFYVDGGVKENIPLEKGLQIARERGIKEVDVIVHSPIVPRLDELEKLGILKLLTRTIDLFSTEVRVNDLKILDLQSKLNQCSLADAKGITVTVYFMPLESFELIPNSLLFDREKMQTLWQAGYDFLKGANDYSYKYFVPDVIQLEEETSYDKPGKRNEE
ncbi:MAG: patatin-like phospholipase family protein, partial [Bacteroidota bacterium]